MPHQRHCQSVARLLATSACGLFAFSALGAQQPQDASSAPASIPAGASSALPQPAVTAAREFTSVPRVKVSSKQAHEADDAYIDGAKHMQHGDLAAADRSFARAVSLDPGKQEYVLALAVLREHRLTDLVQRAAKARLLGHTDEADTLLAEARALDPENSIITQHLGPDASPLPNIVLPEQLPGSGSAPSFGEPIRFAPRAGNQSIHARGSVQELNQAVFQAFGIHITFDSQLNGGAAGKLDLDDVDFATARRVVAEMTHTFAVALQPDSALIAKDDQASRDRLLPQVEETIFMPGITTEAMTEMATLARNVFDLQKVTASTATGNLMVRGDEETLRLLNATYADMLDGGSDVLLEVRLFEIDKSKQRKIGAQLPSSIGGFSVVSEALNLINANQTIIQQAVANGLLTLTGNPAVDYPKELAILIASGAVSGTQFTNLLGTIGTLSGLPLIGVYAGSSATFNLLLNSSDVRIIDAIQVRATSGQPANFRAGTRYPIVTATYSSGISSALSSQLAGLNVNGTNVGSLLSQYLGTSSATIPQIQYEDLGITLKTTPRVLRTGEVTLQLDMKIEALGAGSINSIPVLNNRQIVSSITIPEGQTALLASEVSQNESHAIDGVPGLSELPGFQGTDKNYQKDSGELLITITPHIVRRGNMRIASRRLAMQHTQPSSGGGPQ